MNYWSSELHQARTDYLSQLGKTSLKLVGALTTGSQGLTDTQNTSKDTQNSNNTPNTSSNTRIANAAKNTSCQALQDANLFIVDNLGTVSDSDTVPEEIEYSQILYDLKLYL